jgi:hypothetical protein
VEAPDFCPSRDCYEVEFQPLYFDRRGPAMCSCDNTYFELYDRIHLWKNQKPFALNGTSGGSSEVHLSVMKEAEVPLEWAWWNNVDETFDVPFLTVSNRSQDHTIAIAFDSSIWASSNVGDDRACFHLFPFFGAIPIGESRIVNGRLYYIAGSKEVAYQRFCDDFKL